MTRSRLDKVRRRQAGKQGILYLTLAIGLIVGTVIWGLPFVAGVSGQLIKTEKGQPLINEQRPTPPIFSDIPEATYSAQVRIGGFAQPGLEVSLYLGGGEVGRKLISESGTFVFDNVSLSSGDNTVYAYSTTTHGLTSEQSKSYTIALDTDKPQVTLSAPQDGQVMRGQTARIVNIEGAVDEAGAKVYIGERMAIVGADGKFSLPYQLIEGDQEIPIKAIDLAGNEGEMTLKLRWEP